VYVVSAGLFNVAYNESMAASGLFDTLALGTVATQLPLPMLLLALQLLKGNSEPENFYKLQVVRRVL
jgi:hypothetical protein